MPVPDLIESPLETPDPSVLSRMDYTEFRVNSAGRLECPRCKYRSYVRAREVRRHLQYECGIEGRFLCTVYKKKSGTKQVFKNILREDIRGRKNFLALYAQKNSSKKVVSKATCGKFTIYKSEINITHFYKKNVN